MRVEEPCVDGYIKCGDSSSPQALVIRRDGAKTWYTNKQTAVFSKALTFHVSIGPKFSCFSILGSWVGGSGM